MAITLNLKPSKQVDYNVTVTGSNPSVSYVVQQGTHFTTQQGEPIDAPLNGSETVSITEPAGARYVVEVTLTDLSINSGGNT